VGRLSGLKGVSNDRIPCENGIKCGRRGGSELSTIPDSSTVLLDVAFQESFQSELRAYLPSDAALSLTNLHLLIQTVCEFLAHAYTHCAPSGRAHIEAGIGRHLQQELYDFLLAWLIPTELVQPTAELRATIASWAIYGVAKRWSEGKHNEVARVFVQRALPMIAASLDVE
jgi:hypothetical protein